MNHEKRDSSQLQDEREFIEGEELDQALEDTLA